MTNFTTHQPDTSKIIAALSASFSEQELRTLCFELHIEYEDLPPGGKTDKARELALRCQRERRLPELAEAILRARPHIPRHSLLPDTRTDQSPFKGLLAFQEEDEAIFYGRDSLTTDLLTRFLPPTPFLALVGASGSGKSSIVRAGLLPALRRQTNWPIHVITPTAHPLETLAVTLTRESESLTAATTLLDDLSRDPRSLHLYVRRLLSRGAEGQGRGGEASPAHPFTPSPVHLLLVIDQFEELFTLCKDEAEKKAFVENLVFAVNPETAGPTSIILTLRADFYSHCLQFASLHALLEQQQKIVPAMSTAELRAAIEQPAARAGLVFEEGLVDLLLRDVGAIEEQSPEPGHLPLLSHVLLETWQRREGKRLTLAGYTAAGGVHGAIAKTAESTYQSLTPEQQTIARNIFLRLTELGEGTQDTRRRADLGELLPRTANVAKMEAVLKLLADARLVTTNFPQRAASSEPVLSLSKDAALPPSASEDADSAGAGAYAEVSHEALIREWPTLRRWLDEDREGLRIHRQLTEDAAAWEKTARDVNYLYRGGRLAQAREWAARPDADLNGLEQAFLDAGLAQQQDELAAAKATAAREADAARKLRQRAVFLRGALVIAAALAIVSFLLYGQSSRNARQAEENEAQAFAESTRAFENLAEANTQSTRAFENEGTAVAEAATAEAAKALALANEGTAQAEATRADENLATAVYSERLAATREAEANAQQQKALVQSLAALSAVTYERDQNPELAILLGIEAARLNESNQAGANLLVDNSLRSILEEYAYYSETLTGYKDLVLSVAFSPDGQTLASGSLDSTIRLWDMNNPTAEPVLLTGHEGAVLSVAFSPDGQTLASGGGDETIRLWEMDNLAAEPVVLAGHEGAVNSVTFSPNGQRMASGSGDGSLMGGTIRLWNMDDLEAEPVVLTGHDYSVGSLAFSPDGQTLASGGGTTLAADKTIRLWNMGNLAAEPVMLLGHEGSVFSVDFAPDGQMLASGSGDGTIRLWNMNNLAAEPIVLTGDGGWINSVAFSSDGQTLASGAGNSLLGDGKIRLWDMGSPAAESVVLTGHEGSVLSVAFSPDGRALASGSADRTIKLWDMNGPTAKPVVLTGNKDSVWPVAFSPDGQTLASSDWTTRLWDVGNWAAEPVVLTGYWGWVWSVAFSPDGQTLASGGADGIIQLWDIGNLTAEPVLLAGHSSLINSVAFSPDGQTLASGDDHGIIRLWDMNNLAVEPVVLIGDGGWINLLAFSPDGQTLASGSNEGTIWLWNMDRLTAEPVKLTGHQGLVVTVAFSPDKRILASGGYDGIIRLWDMDNLMAAPVVLSGHEDIVRSVGFSSDGQMLASGSHDRTIRLWDMDNLVAEPVVLTGHEGWVYSVAVAPDGQMLASGAGDGTIRLWPTLRLLVKLGCQQVGRNLNWEEWQRYIPGEPYRQTCPHLPRHPSVPPDA